MKGLGTDEAALIRVLAHLPPLEVPALKQAFQQRHGRSLEHDVEKEVSGHFEMCLLSILRGPLQNDVWSLHKAIHGAGTKEQLLDEVLVGRSNADMKAIKQAYQSTYHRPLEHDVRGDLSAKTERMYEMILSATRQEESAPVLPQNVDADVTELYRATEAKLGTEQLTVCAILTNRSDGQIRAIAQAYEQRYRRPLEKVLVSEFAGHMEQALVQMVRCGADRTMRDAIALEDCMVGAGTKDDLLVHRVVKIHWNPYHVHQVKAAYRQRYGHDLIHRIKGETRYVNSRTIFCNASIMIHKSCLESKKAPCLSIDCLFWDCIVSIEKLILIIVIVAIMSDVWLLCSHHHRVGRLGLVIGATELRCPNGRHCNADSQLIVFLVFWTQITNAGRGNTQISHNGH